MLTPTKKAAAFRKEFEGTFGIEPGTIIILEEKVKELLKETMKECSLIAQHATIPPYSFAVHPDLPIDQWAEVSRTCAHTTAQGIATEIRSIYQEWE